MGHFSSQVSPWRVPRTFGPDANSLNLVRRILLLGAAWSLAFASSLDAMATLVLGEFGLDSRAYWLANHGQMYGAPPDTRDAYLYSPAFAQLIKPLTLLPWPAFAAVWSLFLLAVLLWLLRPLPLTWAIPLGIAGLNEVVVGNVVLLFAVVVVVGFRRPAAWSFVALTKIAPCLGPVWFAARREWLPLLESALATVLIAGLSYLFDPSAWAAWLSFLNVNAGLSEGVTGSSIGPPLVVRIPLAVLLVVWGALTRRVWTLPLAMAFASPVLALGAFAVLLSLPRLYAPGGAGRLLAQGRDEAPVAPGEGDGSMLPAPPVRPPRVEGTGPRAWGESGRDG